MRQRSATPAAAASAHSCESANFTSARSSNRSLGGTAARLSKAAKSSTSSTRAGDGSCSASAISRSAARFSATAPAAAARALAISRIAAAINAGSPASATTSPPASTGCCRQNSVEATTAAKPSMLPAAAAASMLGPKRKPTWQTSSR